MEFDRRLSKAPVLSCKTVFLRDCSRCSDSSPTCSSPEIFKSRKPSFKQKFHNQGIRETLAQLQLPGFPADVADVTDGIITQIVGSEDGDPAVDVVVCTSE